MRFLERSVPTGTDRFFCFCNQKRGLLFFRTTRSHQKKIPQKLVFGLLLLPIFMKRYSGILSKKYKN